MRIIENVKLDYDDVLIRPKRSTLQSRKDVVLERTYKFMHSQRTWTGVPVATANMDSCGTFEMAEALVQYKMLTVLHKFYSVEQLADWLPRFNNPDFVAYTLGVRDGDFEKLEEVLGKDLGKYFNFVCLDVPNAYLERFVKKVEALRKLVPKHTIIAGNLVTNEMAEEIILRGADIVKIGIGPGSACTTRLRAGVGYPQLSAVMESSDAAHGITNDFSYGLAMADGGLVHPADVAKAFCAGADFVMSGKLFSGFDESGGELVERNGKKFKEYFGSSSAKAMEKHYGGKAKHRASEGRSLLIPYQGSVHDFVEELLGSLRSTGTYIGARRLKEFPKRATFIKVNNQVNRVFEKYEV